MSTFWRGYWTGIAVAGVLALALDLSGASAWISGVGEAYGNAVADWAGLAKR